MGSRRLWADTLFASNWKFWKTWTLLYDEPLSAASGLEFMRYEYVKDMLMQQATYENIKKISAIIDNVDRVISKVLWEIERDEAGVDVLVATVETASDSEADSLRIVSVDSSISSAV